jgi:hypothetical protein
LKDILAQWKKLRTMSAECADLAQTATASTDRELLTVLAAQLDRLATDVEHVITATASVEARH